MRFTREQHIRNTGAFSRIRDHGQLADCGAFVLRLYGRTDATIEKARLGVIASRRVGNAVKRNRCKRLLREVFRQNQDCLPANVDVLMIARGHCVKKDLASLTQTYRKGVARILSAQNKTNETPLS